MSVVVIFSVPFVRGKDRPRVTVFGGHAHAYTTDKTMQAEAAIADAWRKVAHGARAAKGVSVRVEIYTYRTLPKSKSKSTISESDTLKPDIDNVSKLILDALNGLAWYDDSQVTILMASKGDRRRDIDEHTTVVVSWEEE